MSNRPNSPRPNMNTPEAAAQTSSCLRSLLHGQRIPRPGELYTMARGSMRPWTQFFNTSNFKKPQSMQRLTGRMIRNLDYFQVNYLMIFIVFMIYSLVTSPMILIVLSVTTFGIYRINQLHRPINLFGMLITCSQQMIAVCLISLPILYFVGAGAALFTTLGASCFCTLIHSIFYNIDAINNDGSRPQVV